MDQRLPFYMIYKTERFMDDEWKENSWGGNGRNKEIFDEDGMCRRDYDYMKSAYPDTAKRIMPYVEDECDRMEYSGSMMFDEYPDQLQLRLMCRRIYEKVREKEKEPEKWLYDLIQVLTYHEIMKRRQEYRKYRRKFY